MPQSFVLPFVAQATQNFVNIEPLREVVSLALVANKHCILYGLGGHGKSTALRVVLQNLEGARVHIQSFGDDMSEARLYGGINLNALEDEHNKRIEYYPENSFLNADYAIFEEGFDAPGAVLLALKDTLSDKILNNGTQRYAMQTQVIFLPTNTSPQEINERGVNSQALVERFPLQLEVRWESYEAADYQELLSSAVQPRPLSKLPFTTVQELTRQATRVPVRQSKQQALSRIFANLTQQGCFVSPRTAVYAIDVIRAAATINQRTEIILSDFFALKYLFTNHLYTTVVEPVLRREITVLETEAALNAYEQQAQKIIRQFESTSTSDTRELVRYCHRFDDLIDTLSNLQASEELQELRDELLETLQKCSTNAYLRARLSVS